jgi:hypothetical protein
MIALTRIVLLEHILLFIQQKKIEEKIMIKLSD